MVIKDAKLEDVRSIVGVHIRAFEGYFLTMLGPDFLTVLYQEFLLRDDGILRAVWLDGKIIGFSAGTIAPETFFAALRRENWVRFLWAALPSLALHPIVVVKKLYKAIFYKGDSVVSVGPAALLSSIAVEPATSGNAAGKYLLEDFEKIVSKRSSFRKIYLITDKNGNDAVISFYQKCNYIQDSEFRQSGDRVMLRLVKVI